MSSSKQTVPLLVGLASILTAEEELPGRYCELAHLWVSDSGMPLVLDMPNLAELRTKTQLQRESDD